MTYVNEELTLDQIVEVRVFVPEYKPRLASYAIGKVLAEYRNNDAGEQRGFLWDRWCSQHRRFTFKRPGYLRDGVGFPGVLL